MIFDKYVSDVWPPFFLTSIYSSIFWEVFVSWLGNQQPPNVYHPQKQGFNKALRPCESIGFFRPLMGGTLGC